MKNTLLRLLLGMLLLGCLPWSTNAQIIETIEESVESRGSSGGSEGNSDGNRQGDNIDLYIDGLFYFARGAGFVLFGFEDRQNPFAVAENGGIEFAEYPYDSPKTGLFRRPGEWGFRSRTYVGLHFLNNEQDLSGGLFQIRYSPIRALSVDFTHLQLVERLEERDETDLLGFSTFTVHYNRLRHHRIHAWWGLGVSFMNGEENYTSPALQAGTTIFIKRPLSLHLEAQAMWFNGLPVQFYQARIQAHVKRFQIYAGYQGIQLNGNHFPAWALGTGVWF